MSTKDSNAIWQPSPNCWPARMGYKPRYIIVHGTAGGGSVSWLTNPASQVSAHYVILQSGQIYQLVDEEASAWGNGPVRAGHDPWWSLDVNPNLITISIEHEKPDDLNQTALTTVQALASFQLQSRICQRWNIPTRPADELGGITGHYSIDPVDKSHCPGTYPWSNLWIFLQQTNGGNLKMLALSDPMGQFFTDGGNGRWHCKNSNVDLSYALLDFYRKHEGALGLPLTNEIYLASMPQSAIQVFERGILIYDPKKQYGPPPGGDTVYMMMLSQGTGQQIIAKPLISALGTQITQLQVQVATSQQASIEIGNLQKQVTAYQQALNNVHATIVPLIQKAS